MPTLTLQFDDRVLKECPVGLMTTIGRLPDNHIVIENPAVSSHHACVFRDGDRFVVEDLGSTNGTFVNDRRVTRHELKTGDRLLVGKHTLVFDQAGGDQQVEPEGAESVISNLGDTVVLDTKKHKALLAQLANAQEKANGTAVHGANGNGTAAAGAVLRVLAGRTEHAEYRLEARTSVIGASDAALVRLRGWFKPQVALAIARNGHGYVATSVEGKTLINNQPAAARTDLRDGDVIRVSGLTLEFRQQ